MEQEAIRQAIGQLVFDTAMVADDPAEGRTYTITDLVINGSAMGDWRVFVMRTTPPGAAPQVLQQ